MITRRCTQRQFLLTPSTEINQIVRFCLSLALEQTGVVLHAVCVMSNHWHGVVTDPQARLPEFLERFHRLSAKVMNALRGRSENFWSSEKTSVVHLATEESVLEKMAYVIANPVAAGLVETPREWPGIVSSHHLAECCSIDMPSTYFDSSGKLPKVTTLQISPPKLSSAPNRAVLEAKLRGRVARLVELARRKRLNNGVKAVGAPAVLRQSYRDAPKTRHLRGALSPRVAASFAAARVQAIGRVRAFTECYRAAWLRWKDGIRDVLFPAGTYSLRVHAGVLCSAD